MDRGAGAGAIPWVVEPRRKQRVASWTDAEAAVGGLIERARAAGGGSSRVVVGITGPVGSGKTSLAARLVRGAGGVLLSTDHYLPDYDGLPEHERDDPRHADLARLGEHLAALRRGERIERPEWCFQAHRRVGSTPVEPGELVVCEGIFALHGGVRGAVDVGVFVDAPAAVRWARWERIEASGERGWGVEHARRYFATVAEPTFARFAGEYRSAADLVVINNGPETGGAAQ